MTRSEERIPKLRSRGRKNRRKMLRVAERMLAENDGEPLKFSEVFEAAGVSRGSAYRIYIGIEDLIQDLASEWLSNFVAYLRELELNGPPESWMTVSDGIVERGTWYWAETSETLKVMPRIRSNVPETYRSAVRDLAQCLDELFNRYFEIPEVPGWYHKLAFYTQLADSVYSDAMRAEGKIGADRLAEAQALCRTYLSFHLPEDLTPRY